MHATAFPRPFPRRPGAARAAALRAPRAFTLLELLMVMAVIAALTAMAAPRYGRALARYRVESAARRLQADLSYARQRARLLSQSVTVAFGTGANVYSIAGMADPDGRAGSYAVNLGRSPYLTTIVSADFAGSSAVTFSGYGIPDAGGEVRLIAGVYSKAVRVDAATGEVTVP